MIFILTFSLLILGSALLTFRNPEIIKPFRDHFGILLMAYGFFHLFKIVLLSTPILEESPLFFGFKMGLWGLLLIMGFILAYPLLERQIFSRVRELELQGQIVIKGFEGMRRILGIAGFALAAVLLLSQTELF
jgi:hypothetical protein